MAYNIFIFILFYSIAVVPYIGMYNKALISNNNVIRNKKRKKCKNAMSFRQCHRLTFTLPDKAINIYAK